MKRRAWAGWIGIFLLAACALPVSAQDFRDDLVDSLRRMNKRLPLGLDISKIQPADIRGIRPRMLGGTAFIAYPRLIPAALLVGTTSKERGLEVESFMIMGGSVGSSPRLVRRSEEEVWKRAESLFAKEIKEGKVKRSQIIWPGSKADKARRKGLPEDSIVEVHFRSHHPKYPVEWGNAVKAGFRLGDLKLMRFDIVSTLEVVEPRRVISKEEALKALQEAGGKEPPMEKMRLAFILSEEAETDAERRQSRLHWLANQGVRTLKVDAETGHVLQPSLGTPPVVEDDSPRKATDSDPQQAQMSQIGMAAFLGLLVVGGLWFLVGRRM